MDIVLKIFGGILLVLGFWVLLTAFDRTGAERTYRIRVSVGSMIAGVGNVLILYSQILGMALIVIGAFIAITSPRPERR